MNKKERNIFRQGFNLALDMMDKMDEDTKETIQTVVRKVSIKKAGRPKVSKKVKQIQTPWTEEEDAILREHYPTMSARLIQEKYFPYRGFAAVGFRASQVLHIRKNRVDVYDGLAKLGQDITE